MASFNIAIIQRTKSTALFEIDIIIRSIHTMCIASHDQDLRITPVDADDVFYVDYVFRCIGATVMPLIICGCAHTLVATCAYLKI